MSYFCWLGNENAAEEVCRKQSKVSTSEKPTSSRRVVSSTPFGLATGQPPNAAGAAAPPATDVSGTVISYGVVVHTAEGLNAKNQVELKAICRKRNLATSGKKQVVIDRILTAQMGPGSY